MESLYTETNLSILAVVAFAAALFACPRPLFKWAINTEFFLGVILQDVVDDNVEKALKLTTYAPSSHVAILVRTFFEEGRAAAEARHLEFGQQHGAQRLKLAAAGLVALVAAGTCGHAVASGIVFWPLIGSAGLSLLLVAAAWRAVAKTEQGCEYVLGAWAADLSAKASGETRKKIRGLLS